MSDNSENESLSEANLSEIKLSEINTLPQLIHDQEIFQTNFEDFNIPID